MRRIIWASAGTSWWCTRSPPMKGAHASGAASAPAAALSRGCAGRRISPWYCVKKKELPCLQRQLRSRRAMGRKVHPLGFRLGINKTWDGRWFAEGKDYVDRLHQDFEIRKLE